MRIIRPHAGILRATVLLALVGVSALPVVQEPAASVPPARTGLYGTLTALHSANGDEGHAVATEVHLADLSLRKTTISVNDISGRGGRIVLATGSPAQLVEYENGRVRAIPGIDMVFLSAPSLSSGGVLAFARDTRLEGRGDELWTWDFAKRRGRKIHELPDGHLIWATRWRSQRRLFVLTRPDGAGNPQILEFVDGRLDRRIRAELGTSFEFGPKGSILQVGSDGTPGFLRSRALWTEPSTGSSRELPDGWQPIAPSPDGKQMLMVSWVERDWTVESTRLGVAPMSNPLAIMEVGSVPGVLFGGFWKAA